MNNTSRPGSPVGLNNNARSVVSNVGSVVSNVGSVSSNAYKPTSGNLQKNIQKLNKNYEQFQKLSKEVFPGEDPLKKAARKQKAKNAYQKKVNSARKTWLASHGMPKNVPSVESSRINKEAREYAVRLYGRNAFEGGKRRFSHGSTRMAESRKNRKNRSRKARSQRGGEAPVGYSNPFPMGINLAQGQQFDAYHANQHGGAVGTYPDAVQQPALLPADLVPSSRLLPLDAAFDYIRQFGPESDLKGGRRSSRKSRKNRKASRKNRKASRKGRKSHRKSHRKSQRGGVLVRWGGGGRGSRKMRGGSAQDMGHPMDVAEEVKMLIPPRLQEQAGLNPEWRLAENPNSFAPNL